LVAPIMRRGEVLCPVVTVTDVVTVFLRMLLVASDGYRRPGPGFPRLGIWSVGSGDGSWLGALAVWGNREEPSSESWNPELVKGGARLTNDVETNKKNKKRISERSYCTWLLGGCRPRASPPSFDCGASDSSCAR
jgi:hypothetical protein